MATVGILEPRVTLQLYFETADVPTEQQFANFLYSYFHLSDLNVGNLNLQGNITASGAVSASLGGFFGSLTSPLGASTDDSVVILTSANELKTDEIDTRVWNISTTGNTTDHLVGGNPSSLENRFIPYVSNTGPNTILNSIIYQTNGDQIGVGTGPVSDLTSIFTVSGSIFASGSLGNITASKYISASLGIYAREYNVIDKLTLGASANKKYIVIGGIGTGWFGISTVLPISGGSHISASGYVTAYNITSSNNISASGYLSASSGDFSDGNITNVGTIYLDAVEADNGTNIRIGDLNKDDDILLTGDVTASQNISASGDLYGRRLLIQGPPGGIGAPLFNFIANGDGSQAGDVKFGVGVTGSNIGIDNYNFIVYGNTTMSNDLAIGGDIEKVINITASGDLMVRSISASKNITASGFISASAGDFADGNITNVGVMYADGVYADNKEIQIGNDLEIQNILLSGPVTASSHISASMTSGNHIIGGKSIHFITPAITASKPFSGSGFQNIIGNNVTLGDACGDNIHIKGTLTSSCSTILGTECTDSIEIKGTVTASCDISSSADLIVREITASNNISSSKGVIAKVIQTDRIQGHNGVTYIQYLGGGGVPGQNLQIFGGIDQDVMVNAQLQVLDDFIVTGSISASGTSVSHVIGGKNFHFKSPHITASYNFSGSGQNNVLGNNVTLGDTCSDSINIKGALTASCGILLGDSCSDQINIRGTVTASCDISSSADLIVRSITASSGISASGKLWAYGADFADQNVTNVGNIFLDSVFPDDGDKIVIGQNGDDNHIEIYGHITASAPGNISASGYLSASAADFADGNIGNVGSISLDQILPDDSINIQIGNHATHDIKIVGDITASYNFSGSGQNNILGNNVTLGDACDDNITIKGTVTASCDISSSGNLILDGEITASGDISSSATISGLSGSFHYLNILDDIVLGNNCEDSITLIGTVTASCDISASKSLIINNITASNLGNSITASGGINGLSFMSQQGYMFSSLGGGIGPFGTGGGGGAYGIQIGASTQVEGALTASLHFLAQGTNNEIQNNVILGTTCADSIQLKGTVTASCDISSSADLIVRSITASGDVMLGNSCADDIIIKGQITSSCNISSSGKIYGLQYFTNDALSLSASNVGGVTTVFVGNTTDRTEIEGTHIKLDGSVTASSDVSASGTGSFGMLIVEQNITASGHISASGDIKGMNYYIDNTKFATGSFNPGGKLQIGNTDDNETRFVFDDNVYSINAVASDPGYMRFSVDGNITASYSSITGLGGNISASGKHSVLGQSVTLGDSCTDSITIKGTVTASCDISSSGTGSFGHILTPPGTTSNITASYAITSSYALSALTASNALTASFTSGTSSYALSGLSSSYAISSSYSLSGSYALSGLSSSYAITSSHALTASFATNTFKASGARLGNSSITGSLTISSSGTTLLNVEGHISTSNNINLKSTSGSSTNLGSPTNKGIIFQENSTLIHTQGNDQGDNIFVGRRAGNLDTVGANNVGLGYSSSVSLTTGNDNVGLGPYSNKQNQTGNRNVAIGREALENNISGDGNIALGFQAGISETGNNKLYIGNDGAASSSIFLFGDMGDSAGAMGIGSSPSLHLKGRFEVSESINASGFLFTSNSVDPGDNTLSVVVWDSGSGRYYHTGSYGQVGGLTSTNTFKGTGQRNGNSAITGSLTVGNITSSGTIGANEGAQVFKRSGSVAGLYLSGTNGVLGESEIQSNGNLYINAQKPGNIQVNNDKLDLEFFVHTKASENPNIWSTYHGLMGRVGMGITSSIEQPKAKLHVSGGASDWFQSDINPLTYGSIQTSIYASHNISASGHLNIKTNHDNWNQGTEFWNDNRRVLVIDPITGRLTHTGSYGAGGGVSSTNTFKGSGTRNGNSFITGSLTLVVSGSTGGKLVIPDTDANGMGLIQFGSTTMLHNRGTETLVLGENHPHSVSINYSTVVGHSNATGIQGDYNQLFGYEHMPEAQNTLGNTLVGTQHLSNYAPDEETVGYNTMIGYNCFDTVTGTAVVNDAGGGVGDDNKTKAAYNIGIGYKAGRSSVGSNNIFIGFEAGRDTTGSYDIAIGEGKRHGSDPHFRSLIEGEMRPRGFGEASGRARINNVLALTPTGSLPPVANSKMGDLCVVNESANELQSQHYTGIEGEAILYFFNGVQWKVVNLS